MSLTSPFKMFFFKTAVQSESGGLEFLLHFLLEEEMEGFFFLNLFLTSNVARHMKESRTGWNSMIGPTHSLQRTGRDPKIFCYSKFVFMNWQCCFSGLEGQTLPRLGCLQDNEANSHLSCGVAVFSKKEARPFPFSYPY